MSVWNKFRSAWTAAWACFFEACDADYIYCPKIYTLGDGSLYAPDFLVRNVKGRCGGDLFVEVADNMTNDRARKIKKFASINNNKINFCDKFDNPVLVVGKLPVGEEIWDIINSYNCYRNKNKEWPQPMNFNLIDGDFFGAHIGLDKNGRIALFGDDSNYLKDMDYKATENAFHYALNECVRTYMPLYIPTTSEHSIEELDYSPQNERRRN